MKKEIFFFVFLIFVISCTPRDEIIAEKASEVKDGSNPKFSIQYPAGTDIFRVEHSGNARMLGTLNVTESMNTTTALVREPPVRCPAGTYMVYTNLTTSICVASDINQTDINVTSIQHDQNITHWRNSSWGFFNNGTCIVIGDLNYVSEC